jgi:hypothetical protein
MVKGMNGETAPSATPMQLNTLTLERNAVLVARVAKDSGYDFEELRALRKSLQDIFPTHQVFVWYDDMDFMAIHDKGYAPERMSVINDASNYY